jgi:hypothetical protein
MGNGFASPLWVSTLCGRSGAFAKALSGQILKICLGLSTYLPRTSLSQIGHSTILDRSFIHVTDKGPYSKSLASELYACLVISSGRTRRPASVRPLLPTAEGRLYFFCTFSYNT